MKERLDVLVYARKLSTSRSSAVTLIERGSVKVNGAIVTKASKVFDQEVNIEVLEPLAFVSRAGEKLEYALATWQIAVRGLTAADIGASTGGFTDCLLQHGAQKVYAIDVGTDQLDSRLRRDSRVISIEQTDIRKVILPEQVDFVCIDVSFISLIHILESAKKILRESGVIVALVKPQFEVGPNQVDKKGIVLDESKRKKVLDKIKDTATKTGLKVLGETQSPITGSKGNVEYLLYLQK